MKFFDNASTTRPSIDCLDIFKQVSVDEFYNPSSLYNAAVNNKKKLDEVKRSVLSYLKADGNFIFTSGATEANNLIINGVLRNKHAKLVFSVAEHPSIYNVAKHLESIGYNVVFLPVSEKGVVSASYLQKVVDANTSLVSIMHVNNETGAVNNIKELVSVAKAKNPNVIFHSDGVQACGKVPVNLTDLNVDAYTISAHKMHGVKGVGGLFIKNNINLKPSILGGGQQGNYRSGTENFAGVCSFNHTITDEIKNQPNNYSVIKALSSHFKKQIKTAMPDVVIISDDDCSPYIVSLSVGGIMSETLVYMLDEKGFLVGSGSACSSKLKKNRVLSAMGYSANVIESAIRISFSKHNTIMQVDELIIAIKKCRDEYLEKIKR